MSFSPSMTRLLSRTATATSGDLVRDDVTIAAGVDGFVTPAPTTGLLANAAPGLGGGRATHLGLIDHAVAAQPGDTWGNYIVEGVGRWRTLTALALSEVAG